MIILMRHGRTLGGRGRCIGQTDLPLSDTGYEQARFLADAALAASAQNSRLKALYASPLTRCMDTASPLAGACNLNIIPLPALAEINLGEWEGLGFDEIRARYPREYERRGLDFAGFRPPCGECFGDLGARAASAFDIIAGGPLPALAVTHAGVIRTLLCRCLDIPLSNIFRFTPEHAHATVLSPAKDGTYRLSAFNIPPSAFATLLSATCSLGKEK